jgi:hypothetical protein
MSSAMQRIIVDASTLVAAYGSDGEVRAHWRNYLGGYKVAISPEVLIDVEAKLRNGEVTVPTSGIRAILVEILERCDIVRPAPLRDSKFDSCKEGYLAALARHRFADGVPAAVLLTAEGNCCGEVKIANCRVLSIGEFCKQLTNTAAK